MAKANGPIQTPCLNSVELDPPAELLATLSSTSHTSLKDTVYGLGSQQKSPLPPPNHERCTSNSLTRSSVLSILNTTPAFALAQPLSSCQRDFCLRESSQSIFISFFILPVGHSENTHSTNNYSHNKAITQKTLKTQTII